MDQEMWQVRATMCELLAFSFRYPDALPGGSAEGAYEQFATEHLRTWAPRFAARVQEEARLPFYRAAAQLLAAFAD